MLFAPPANSLQSTLRSIRTWRSPRSSGGCFELVGMQAETVKEMSKDLPRRIASLRTRLTIPLPADHPQRPLLEQAAHTCPVHKSLSPEIDAAIEFVWAGPRG